MKERTLNEYRQTKEYQGSEEGRKYLDNLDPVKQVMAQQIDELEHADNKGYKDIAGDPDLIESAKELITNKILKHFDDVLFQMVCEEMGDNYMFQSRNYLTEAGYELFEDEWYEFYHEHHSDILYRVKHGLFE